MNCLSLFVLIEVKNTGVEKIIANSLDEQVIDLAREYETVLWVSDHHIPYQDNKVINGTIELAKDLQPDKIIFGGDIVDFYQVSSFDKNPERAFTFQKDLDKGYEMLKRYV